MKNYIPLHLQMLKKFNFNKHLQNHGLSLNRNNLLTLQINVGKKCNQACHHCHVDASPKRSEQMTKHTVERILTLIEKSSSVKTVDITGGAPELNPNFRYLVEEAKQLKCHVMDRCNLTILLEEGQETLAEFLAGNEVEIIASLPCYSSENVDTQRGRGVFNKSIAALRKLNQLGYGKSRDRLLLNLVYNPIGNTLPPPQEALEVDYKKQLKSKFDIEFNNLFTITNMPISRFADQLNRSSQLDAYMNLLIEAFNPSTLENLMCRSLISIGWQGHLYDCDFNQMLEMKVPGTQTTIWNIDSMDHYKEKFIATGAHCFGCMAGAGSSCSGVLS